MSEEWNVLDENNRAVTSMDSVEAFWFNNCFFKRDERESCGHSLIIYNVGGPACQKKMARKS